MDNTSRINNLRKKLEEKLSTSQDISAYREALPKVISEGVKTYIANSTKPSQNATIAQDCAPIDIYVLYSVADSSQCWDENLFNQDTPKIMKALHIDKSEINFEDLGWYLMSKYPDLYKFGEELDKEKDLHKASKEILRIKTHRIAQKIDLPTVIMMPEDIDFPKKELERHQLFLDFLDKGNPEEMPFAEMIKITGSIDYMNLEFADSNKKNKFTNIGYKILGDFMAGKLDIKPENVGEAYLFFKQILKDTTRRAYDLPFDTRDVLYDCVIPQLENVRNGRYPTTIEKFYNYSAGLAQANKALNERYNQATKGKLQRQEDLSQTMQEHTFIDSQKCCRKDSTYYDALYDKVLLKYNPIINKYEYGIEKYAGLNDKVNRVLNAILKRKEQLVQSSKNLQQSNVSMRI